MERFLHNRALFDERESERLRALSVCVVGAGGLGGFVCEGLVRMGVTRLCVIDGDSFDKTNLNRQLLCTERTLNTNKAIVACERAAAINPMCVCRAESVHTDEANAHGLLAGSDVVFDCLDSADTRRLLGRVCGELSVPLIHGAVGGSCGQACLVTKETTLERLYAAYDENENAVVAPMLTAGMQLAVFADWIRGHAVPERLYVLDAARLEIEKFDLGETL